MIINSNTKISELLKENSQALDAISSLAKPLEKLRNPILRKLMASRTTIQEAASIGGCSVEEFFLVLRPLGFESGAPASDNSPTEPAAPLPEPEWLKGLPGEKITALDVRAMLASGHDPLKEIMAAYKKVAPGTALKIINTFVPTPLLKLLENKGAETYAQTPEPKLVYSYFYKPDNVQLSGSSEPQQQAEAQPEGPHDQIATVDESTFMTELNKFGSAHVKIIDVRQLEMPEPMHAILGELDILPTQDALYVYHKRIPVYLLEDLQRTGTFNILIWPVSDKEVKLLLTHRKQ